ncbi:MAG: bifunctional adenosylcobinamide kinase/adenosylcobinamide-phosphate guanylyltransferase [Syntrophaceae bacterium]|nr:bifunctional adenosylcobinamide kinase/adenosylcobinamide-phosphate guanylyltransferase [Syntrophaceae bacterium]
MARVILVTGGSRSGKSGYSQARAEALPGPRACLATCPVIDAEMAERVRKHREARQGGGWETIEESHDLAGAINRAADFRVLLVDCLTLWMNNLFYAAELEKRRFTEETMVERARELITSAAAFPGTVFFIANELGMGIVPEEEQTRRFRDCAGRLNQFVAAAADEVVFMVSGLPLVLKGP